MPEPYQYKFGPGDNPLTVAEQFQTTPQALIQANPGGYPFATGQMINVPQAPQAVYQYKQPIGPQPAPTTPTSLINQGVPPSVVNSMIPPANPYDPSVSPWPIMGNGRFEDGSLVPTGFGRNTPQNRGIHGLEYFQEVLGQTQAGISAGKAPNNVPASMLNALGATPESMAAAGYTRREDGTWTLGGATSTTGSGQALASGDFYGYERDPETGRSVRVIKNSASASLMNEMRWDPQARRYVSVGRLIKQGKLDLKGGWHKQSRRQRQSAAIQRKQQQQTQKEDFTLANSLISFSASSG